MFKLCIIYIFFFIEMDNDEILMRMKKHYLFFLSLEGQVDDDILNECKKYMELLFLNLLRNNMMTKL
jgi:hypothetical protein